MTNTSLGSGTVDTTASPSSPSSTSTAQQAQAAAGEVASTARDQASNVVDTSKQQVQAVAQDTTQHARQLVSQSREQLREQANEQARRVAGTLSDISRQLHGMARGEAPPQGMVADMTHQLASSADRVSSRLEQGGFDGLVDDVTRFARNRPGMFLLASLGAGFAVTRLLRNADTHALMEAAKPDTGGQSGPSGVAAFAEPATIPMPLGEPAAVFESTSGTIDLRAPEA